MKSRTKARSIALQVLYEFDVTGHPVGEVFKDRIEETPLDDNTLVQFALQIVQGVLPLITQLDELIAQHAPEWPMDQVAVIDRNILRIALWEFGVERCTPIKVAINEAIELAKLFGSDSAPRFINGVLGALAAQENQIQQILRKSQF
ncbi:MAG: transcription antitermination factor NusB [Anaerolineaceae bacterium]